MVYKFFLMEFCNARAIDTPVRRAIWLRFCAGQSVAEIAKDLQVSRRTVRHLVQLFQTHGEEAAFARYDRCGPHEQRDPPAWQVRAQEMRHAHPRWGAVLIRTLLLEEFEAAEVPCVRTLQRCLPPIERSAPRRSSQQDKAPYQRASKPHACWQVDAADQLRLQTGQLVSWLRVVDECSGAVLKTVVFPPMLEREPCVGHAICAARAVLPMGLAGAVAPRSRLPVGQLQRRAAGPGVVAFGPERVVALEPARQSAT